MSTTRTARRPSAASRTLCLWGCGREGCRGGDCTTSTPPDQMHGAATVDVAIDHAASWAEALVAMHGVPMPCAARLAARRYGADDRLVYMRIVGVRLAPAWRRGPLLRPTRRPTRTTVEDIDMEHETERGAA